MQGTLSSFELGAQTKTHCMLAKIAGVDLHVLSQKVEQHTSLHATLHGDSARILIHLYGERRIILVKYCRCW